MNFLKNAFLSRDKQAYPNYWDAIALMLVFGIIALLAWQAKQMSAPYHLGQALPLSLDPRYLPGYALRTVARMLVALIVSLLFTFIFATWAAKSKRAEGFIIPLIDIMQSIPILGFLSITVVGFIRLFPGSLLGPECAAVFAIFTSQAWNMALGFYQTVRSVPEELNEAAKMFHLTAWQRFWRIDVPFSMPGLLWNTMVSMSAGWFFVVASEAISVSNQQILLPGIGSYITLAIQAANIKSIVYAIITMFVVIVLYDQLLFRPLVAWAEKFKSEQVASEPSREAQSWVINLFHRTRFLRLVGQQFTYGFDNFVNLFAAKPISLKFTFSFWSPRLDQLWQIFFYLLLLSLIGCSTLFLAYFILTNVTFTEIIHVFFLGLITALRVFILLILCSFIWVPIGVWVGLRPNVAYYIQPLAQFLAAFPANLLYPLFVIFIVTYHLNVNVWLTPLMILGAQWYILFNIIAGASVIPKELLMVADNLDLSLWLRWRRLILPSIFPYYITGAITAVGGTWNASIVAEVVSWGNQTLVATGLGAYIFHQTQHGDFIHTALGIAMMAAIVLFFNRTLWRPLYAYAERRYSYN